MDRSRIHCPIRKSQCKKRTCRFLGIDLLDTYRRSAALSSLVTSVSELSDVQPTDWAFQALQSLVERYGVIAGYKDGTFKGDRALTRYEFAAGLILKK
jgi:S-layer homology domain